MNRVPSASGRLTAVLALRDAALVLLDRTGIAEDGNGNRWFEPHTPENSEPRMSVLLAKHPLRGYPMLNIWATLKSKHVKVLNMEWTGQAVALVTFRRGEWESELLAMARASAVAVH
jgi:hypothetical protein